MNSTNTECSNYWCTKVCVQPPHVGRITKSFFKLESRTEVIPLTKTLVAFAAGVVVGWRAAEACRWSGEEGARDCTGTPSADSPGAAGGGLQPPDECHQWLPFHRLCRCAILCLHQATKTPNILCKYHEWFCMWKPRCTAGLTGCFGPVLPSAQVGRVLT